MKEVLTKIDDLLLQHSLLNKKAMRACQAIGYNGFKRMHRRNAKKFSCLQIDFENDAFDLHREFIGSDSVEFNYRPANLKEHLKMWEDALSKGIEEIGSLNNQHREKMGEGCEVAEKTMHLMLKNREKVRRWYYRFEECGWNPIEMHIVDDYLHKKCKTKGG